MVDFFNMRVQKICEKENPPSYENKIPNCSFPHCDEGEPCERSYEIVRELRKKDATVGIDKT